jgi:Salmonella virulence plasmid 65kDa B protein
MKMKTIAVLITLSSLWYMPVKSQPQNSSPGQRLEDLKTVIPSSPNAASLGKYGNWPVSLYTGTAGIQIPLYTLNSRSINLPIGLSYHASGIRVSDVASWVGLGWSLSGAGGVISRSVRGMPDEIPYGIGYHSFRQQFINPDNLASGTGNLSTNNQLKIDAADGKVDTEPDMYSMNVLGRSYKLFFKGDGSVITIPYSNIKVTANLATDYWKIVLEDGTQLIFGENCSEKVSANRNWHIDVPRDPFSTAWYVKQIISVNGETVNFSYTTYTLHQNNTFHETDYFKNSAPYGEVACAIGSPCVIPSTETPKNKPFVQHGDGLNLAAIETADTRVDFIESAAEREDMQHGRYLSAVKVFSKQNNTCIKTFTFNYAYSTAVTDYNAGSTSYHKKRLKLMQVDEAGADMVNVQSWQLQYNPVKLPSVKSYAQDHWGYYNGANFNTTLLPQIFTDKYVVRRGFDPDVTPVGNREPNAFFMQAEMLNKIIYPTGGYSSFEFEPNSYPAQEEQFATQYIPQSINLLPNSATFINTVSTPFTVTREQFVFYYFNGVFSPNYLSGMGANSIMARCKILDSNGNALSTLVLRKTELDAGGYKQKTDHAYLPPGNYILETSSIVTEGELSEGQTILLNAQLKYEASAGIQTVNKMCGGIRIKKTEDFDAVTNKVIKKIYQYEQPFVINEFSYDKFYLGDMEKELDRYYSMGIGPEPCAVAGTAFPSSNCYQKYLVRSSSSKFDLGNIQGSTVGYGKVTTLYGDNGANGYTVSEFLNVPDENVYNALEFPYPPVNSKDWQRGQMIKETVYTSNQIMVSKTEHQYEYLAPVPYVSSYKAGWARVKFIAPEISTLMSDLITNLKVQDVVVSSGMIRPATTIKTEYPNGIAAITNTVNFFYDNPANLSATRTETTNSKGELVKLISRTPLEKAAINTATPLTAAAAAAIDSMLARNIINPVLQTETFKGSNLQASSLVNYKLWSGGILQPENVQLQQGNGALKTKVLFTAYDALGNLLEQRKINDVQHTYIYDYNNSYTIAEAVNAATTDIAATSFEAESKGNFSFTGLPVADAYAPTGKKIYPLTGGNISKTIDAGKTYTVSLWANSSAAVNGTAPVRTGKTLSGYTYYEYQISNSGTVTISGSGNIDELKLHPANAQMTTYTYEPLIGMTSQSDAAGNIQYYEYDNVGRLKYVRDMDRNVVKVMEYKYKTGINN